MCTGPVIHSYEKLWSRYHSTVGSISPTLAVQEENGFNTTRFSDAHFRWKVNLETVPPIHSHNFTSEIVNMVQEKTFP
jgi:hypothetical protein